MSLSTLVLSLVDKNQTLIAVRAAQPLAPVFKLYQVVNRAQADERMAMAKAGMPVSAAEPAVGASKAKAAADIKGSCFSMEPRELAQRMGSAVRAQATGSAAENPELFLTKAKREVQMFLANLECCEALAGLKALMRQR